MCHYQYNEIGKGKAMMFIFYIICACITFAIAGVVMQFNRLALYRRRIIRHFNTMPQHQAPNPPFVLSEKQEKQLKQCFLKGINIQECIEQLEE